MRIWTRVPLFMSVGLGAVVLLLLSTAWFQIQSVRWGYRLQSLQQQLDDVQKKEQSVDQRLEGALSLARLDDLAKNKFNLRVPAPSQIRLVSET